MEVSSASRPPQRENVADDNGDAGRREPSVTLEQRGRQKSTWSVSSSLRVLSRTSSMGGGGSFMGGGSGTFPASRSQRFGRTLRTMVREFVAAYYRDLMVVPSRVEQYYTVRRRRSFFIPTLQPFPPTSPLGT